jgi:3-oxoacyl-[acyl-carrier protein] reductase
MDRLKGKIAIITGAGSGMGKATAIKFANEGAKVVVADIAGDKAEATAAEIRAAGGQAAACQADISKSEDCRRMVDAAVNAFGGLNILYNNAALPQKEIEFQNCSDEEFERIMRVNLQGAFMACKAAYPEFLKAGGGVFLATASLGAIMPRGKSIAYSPSKAAVICMYKVLASELAKDNIRANVILPGPTASPMLKQFMAGDRASMSDEEIANVVSASMPFGHCVEPTDIADAAVFLASDEARMITGETLLVDGGRSVARGRD